LVSKLDIEGLLAEPDSEVGLSEIVSRDGGQELIVESKLCPDARKVGE
jgi:hypothetical protein